MRMVMEAQEWCVSAALDCVTEAMRAKRNLLKRKEPVIRVPKKGEEESKVIRKKMGEGRPPQRTRL
jgi:hypothetical protein